MTNTENVFTKTIDRVIAVLLGVIMLLTGFQVLSRYVLFIPAPWVEEFISFLFVWMIFLGAAYAQLRQEHTRLELIPLTSSKLWVKSILLIGNLAILVLLIVVIVQGIVLVLSTMPMPSQILKFPMGILYLAAPVGALIMAWATLLNIVRIFSRR